VSDTTTEDTAADAEAPASATTAAFTDAEISSFAAAVLKIQSLGDAGTASQEKMTAIVTESGIAPETYVAISKAMQTDPEVARRVQVAAAALQPGSAG
jgi:hypothetical protein